MYYIRYGEFQKHLTDYYKENGKRIDFLEMLHHLYIHSMLSETRIPNPPFTPMTRAISNDEINAFVDSLVMTVHSGLTGSEVVQESDMFPVKKDVFIIRHPQFTCIIPHTHNYFEINYVIHGKCVFQFEESRRILCEGDMCIIAAGSRHGIEVGEDATVFTIMLRKSTFGKIYMSLLSNQDMLSRFFYSSLMNQADYANYILFHCPPTMWMLNLILNAMVECNSEDPYSNVCSVSIVNQIFAYLMRNHAPNVEMFNYQIGSEFAMVLQYIQLHYRTLTLSDLAAHFHYSVPYLCTLIKQSTGKTFSELVKELRLADAGRYLINSTMKIYEIADLVGYNSADHFSRTFRAEHHMSPQAYRKKYTDDDEVLIPYQKQ